MQLKINAEKLKQLRENNCWSQQQLSELSGLSLRTVQRIEAKSVASQESIKCLAAVFEIQVQDLFEDTALITSAESTETPSPTTPPPESSTAVHSADNDMHQFAQGKLEVKRLYIAFALVFASHIFGFYGIFSAYGEQRIDVETFQVLKNTVSGALLFSTAVFLFKFIKLKKKFGLGSFLL